MQSILLYYYRVEKAKAQETFVTYRKSHVIELRDNTGLLILITCCFHWTLLSVVGRWGRCLIVERYPEIKELRNLTLRRDKTGNLKVLLKFFYKRISYQGEESYCTPRKSGCIAKRKFFEPGERFHSLLLLK